MKRAKLKAKKKPGASDFLKKKQKVGKAKAASENTTDTSFKSRSVIILPQLERSDEPTSRRKLPLQTLLNHLSHHNASTRRNALSGIEELFMEHPDLLLPSLGKLVEGTCVAFTDQEPSVRRALHLLLKHVLAGVTSDQLQPFIPLYVAHLSCAFTHIADEIQMDAMKAFQLLLELHPRLLVDHAPKLLTHLIQLLSRHRSPSGARASSQVVPSSISLLTSNPSSKLSLQTSRAEVFGQLCQFLKLLLGTVRATPTDSHLCFGRHSAPIVDVAGGKVFETAGSTVCEVQSGLCDLTGPIPCVAVLRNSGIRIANNTMGVTATMNRLTLGGKGALFFSSHEELWHFLQNLFSLLLECWVECNPSRLSATNASVKPLALALMETILNLQCLLAEIASAVDESYPHHQSYAQPGPQTLVEKLGSAFFSDLEKHLLGYFPFLYPPGGRGLLMNLTVCKMFLLLLNGAPSWSAPSFFEAVCSFLAGLGGCLGSMTASSHLVVPCVQCTAEIIPVFVKLASLWGVAGDVEEKVFAGFFSLYASTCSQSSSKHLLTVCYERLLASELNAHRNSSLLMTKLLLPWLQTLPQLLVHLGSTSPEISAVVADTLAAAAVRGVDVHIKTMHENLRLVFGSQSTLSQLPAFVQRKTVELLWHVPELGSEDLASISRCILSGRCDLPTMLHLIQIIHLKMVGLGTEGWSSGASIGLYLSFMLTLVFGYSKEQLVACRMQVQQNIPDEAISDPILVKPVADRDTAYCMGILNCACRCLMATPFSDQVLPLMQAGLIELMCPEGQRGLPYDAAFGIMTLCSSFSQCRGVFPPPLVAALAKLCCTIIVASAVLSPLEADHHLTVESLKNVTHQFLRNCEPAVRSLVHHFKHIIQVAAGAQHRQTLVAVLVQMLNTPALNGALRKQAGEVVEAVSEIMVWRQGDRGEKEEWLDVLKDMVREEERKELEVAVQKYIQLERQ